MIAVRTFDLPWAEAGADAQRFRSILLTAIGVAFVLSLIIPWLPVADLDQYAPELPDRIARLVVELPKPPEKEKVELPPPPPPPERVVEAKPEPKPLPKPEPVPVVEEPVPDPVEPTETARERAEKAGVMAFADQLADLRQAVPSSTLQQQTTAAAGSGPAERALVTSSRRTSSGGINTAALSRNTGGGGNLAARETTRVESSLPAAPQRTASDRRASEAATGARSREEIELVFDKNKAAIYSLYRRALRADPSLQGKIVLSLTIAPGGQVTDVSVVSSELASPELEAKLIRRVRMFDFGARDVSVTTTTKPIDFFPA